MRVLEQRPADEAEPATDFSAKKIRGRFLENVDEDDEDRRRKLVLSRKDKKTLFSIIDNAEISKDEASPRLLENFDFFQSQLAESTTDLRTVCVGIGKLKVVEVGLTHGTDNPQKVFESMNSTGKQLSQSDLIRNFVLMDLEQSEQNMIFRRYWEPLEKIFEDRPEYEFDTFVRDYLTMKTEHIPNKAATFEAFRSYVLQRVGRTTVVETIEEVTQDLLRYGKYYSSIAFGTEEDVGLKEAFNELAALRATVSYPLLLSIYDDWQQGLVTYQDFVVLVRLVISYIVRRAVCGIPTNSLNKIFATIRNGVTHEGYIRQLSEKFAAFTNYQRFPDDEEFRQALVSFNLYDFRRRAYVLDKLENAGKKEQAVIDNYTIEHILPQNPNLSLAWQEDLGADWKEIQGKYLHTLGNLTLTGYNSEYSDRPFIEKRDMKDYGLRYSPLRLNRGLGELDHWNEAEINERAERLADLAVDIWGGPVIGD